MKHKKCLFLVASVVVFSAQSVFAATPLKETYMEVCTRNHKHSQGFCSCALTSFSDMMREQAKKHAPGFEQSIANNKQKLLSAPAMTEDKINAVCALHEAALEYKQQAATAELNNDHAGDRAYSAKKLEMLGKQKSLAASYNLQPGVGYLLEGESGGYCDAIHDQAQLRKDLAADDGGIYPKVQRMLGLHSLIVYTQIMKRGNHIKCSE